MITAATLVTWIFVGLYIFWALGTLAIIFSWLSSHMGNNKGLEDYKLENQKFQKRIAASVGFIIFIGILHGVIWGII